MKLERLFSRVKSRLAAVFLIGIAVAGMAGFAEKAFAQEFPSPPVTLCAPFAGQVYGSTVVGTGGVAGVTNQFECRYYESIQALSVAYQKTLQFAVVRALLDSMTVFTQKIAENTAKWILAGPQNKPAFFQEGYEEFLKATAQDLVNRQISAVNQSFFKEELGWDLCQPVSLNLKLALAAGRVPRPGGPDCTFDSVKQAFNQSVQNLDRNQIAKTLKSSISMGGNDINIALMANQKVLRDTINAEQNAILERGEGKGFKLVKDYLNGTIKLPSEVALETVNQGNLVKGMNERANLNTNVMAMTALGAGIKQLPIIAGYSFAHTFIMAGVDRLQDYLNGNLGQSTQIAQADLSSPDADPFAEPDQQGDSGGDRSRQIAAAFMSDVFRPNLNSSDNQDFVTEMSSCPTPRGLWGCSMDQGLAAALRSSGDAGALTVDRAAGLKQGTSAVYLHPDWELIPEWENKDSRDPGCYQRAYCATNLAKMRFARILPMGWELAANSVSNKKKDGKYVTLGEVIQGFNDCNAQGRLDAEHPWCHLINPSWPLVAPPFKCDVRAFTDSVIGEGPGKVRLQECTDVSSCLQRDDQGNCVGGYGYCVADKTVWRFGANQCDEKYASCRTYRRPSKQLGQNPDLSAPSTGNDLVSYVRNTIDYGSCNAGNAGCMYYSTMRDVATVATDRWVGAIGDNWGITGPRIYFDKTVQPCDASGEGCTKVLPVTQGESALNLVENASFEKVDEKTKMPAAWSLVYTKAGDMKDPAGQISAFNGANAIFPTESFSVAQDLEVSPLRNYTVSFYARGGAGAAADVNVTFFKDSKKTAVADDKSFYRSCSPGSSYVYLFVSQTSPTWQRYTCTFVSNADAHYATIKLTGSGSNVDAVQLEEGEVVTPFIDGVSTTLAADYLKIAPEELGCYQGTTSTTRAECKNFARSCSQIEMGCQAYRASDGSDSTEIPATLSKLDYCPTSCIGYAEYRKLTSSFDLVKSEDTQVSDESDNSVAYFIPSKALTCSAADAGCEEFTNIESQAQGGEQKAYFTYTRACQKPDASARTYFTWEGSDSSGYQLRTWSLVSEPQALANEKENGPKILKKAGPDGVVKNSASCTQAIWSTGADVDCRQFYDEAGNVFYRYYSQTVLSSAECTDYRKNNSTADDCNKTGGEFVGSTGQCVYKVIASQSNSCSASVAGCRAYLGTKGRNAAVVVNETFPSTTLPAVYTVGNLATELKVSDEALLVGDHSLQIKSKTTAKTETLISFESVTGSLYTFSFWGKAPAAKPGTLVQIAEKGKAVLGQIQLSPEWKRYELGPFKIQTGGTSRISFLADEDLVYVDSIEMRRLQDIAYVVKDKWTIPQECDRNQEGLPQPQAMLGCREYTDRKDRKVAVREFNDLCRFESVGCTGYVDTRNSDSAYAETFAVEGNSDTGLSPQDWNRLYTGKVSVTRPADRYMYLIDEPSAHCDASQMSCRAFGKPKLNPMGKLGPETPDPKDPNAGKFETIYLIDDIKKYVKNGELDAMCKPSELFCDTFASGQVTSYFRDPDKHVCEWRDNVQLAASNVSGATYPAGLYSGWFVQGVSPARPCYPNLLSSARTFLTEYPGSPNYKGWTSLCPKDQSECTEFRDTVDHSDSAHPLGKTYYFISNDKVDRSSCNGKVDPTGGCVLLRDMNDGALTSNAVATYAFAHASGDIAVSPIDCKSDPSNPYCKNAGLCKNVRLAVAGSPDAFANAFVKGKQNAACSVDADCQMGSVGAPNQVLGECQVNDSNNIVKVRLDRDCGEWLGCRSGETVYDDAQQKYVDLCTNYALCDRVGGASQGLYCGHYVDRDQMKLKSASLDAPYFEPILREGLFLNGENYSIRATSFSDADYSGYSIPNRFQIADLVSRRVGYELLKTKTRAKYSDDYRMVASVPIRDPKEIPTGATDSQKYYTSAGSAVIVDQNNCQESSLCQYVGKLDLCLHTGTKQVGYYVKGENPSRCYMAVDTQLTQLIADLQFTGGGSRGAQNLATILEQDANASKSLFLNQIMPGAECRAYPDVQAPFSNEFVKEWDTTVTPNAPKEFVGGYDGVKYCEKGEDCSCQYAKVTYGSDALTAPTKFYSVLSRQAPPQGICVGGKKDGQACIVNQAGAGATDDMFGLGALQSGSGDSAAFNECGGGGTCQALGSVSMIRGMSGYCLQRDASVTVGDKGRTQCLSWHPQPVLVGSKDVYHFSPTIGYYPALNSGEYYCASPSYGGKSGMTVNSGMKSFKAPGEATSFIYDERCVSASYNFAAERVQGYTSNVYWDQKGQKYEEMKLPQQGFLLSDPNNKLYNAANTPSCKNIDGTSLRATQMAKWCGASPKTSRLQGTWSRAQQIGEGDIMANFSADMGKAGESLMNSFGESFKFPGFNAELLAAPFVNVWNGFKASVNAVECFVDGFGGGDDCDRQMKVFGAYWKARYYDRASYAVPTPGTIDDAEAYTFDDKTMRLVTTGEGKDRSYAEYFIPATSELVQNVLKEAGATPGQTGTVYESQLGYFDFHVPEPGSASSDFTDETEWTAKAHAPANGPGGSSDIPLLGGPGATPNQRDRVFGVPGEYTNTEATYANGWYWSWDQMNNILDDHGNVGPEFFKLDWTFQGSDDPAKAVKDGQSYGQLACLFSPEWVDNVEVKNWDDENEVVTQTKEWYKGFKKEFKGTLSRSNAGYLKNNDGTLLQQMPCQNGSGSCYYKFWELGYRDEGQEKFTMADPGPGKPVSPNFGATPTYFKRSLADKPYFSIRAMFESVNAEDNKKSPLSTPVDGSTLRGPFKFVGFWVTAAAPGTNSSRAIYMRMSVGTANACRDVAQVISPDDRKNAAFTDRVWEQSGFMVPGLAYTYGVDNPPFGAALHQRMIGADPMLMIDQRKFATGAGSTFVKPGSPYLSVSSGGKEDKNPYNYHVLSNLFARIYQVYSFYDLPVGKDDKMCFFGPFAGKRCNASADCDPRGTCQMPAPDCKKAEGAPKGTCQNEGKKGQECSSSNDCTEAQGLCRGGAFNGKICSAQIDCELGDDAYAEVYEAFAANSCAKVTENDVPTNKPSPPGSTVGYGYSCQGDAASATDPNDPDKDANRCTHGVGYYPRPEICPSGQGGLECLTSLPYGNSPKFSSYNLKGIAPPTDVTSGLYGLSKNEIPIAHTGLPTADESQVDIRFRTGSFTSSYHPKAPRIAAPDVARQCASPGQCAIAKLNAMSIETASEGPVIFFGSQAQVTARFYAWSADNQAPLTDVWIDWGDGSVQRVSEGRIKNKKPFCGVQKQCEFAPGLTCNSDADCPTGAGKCYGTSFCSNDPGRSCTANSECGTGTCDSRLTYGNSPAACEQNYFEFKHSYQCSTTAKPSGTCIGGLPTNGQSCEAFLPGSGNTTVCRFVPRVFVEDNWGWCTGTLNPNLKSKNIPESVQDFAYKAGGCYDGSNGQNVLSGGAKGTNFCDADALRNPNSQNAGTCNPWLPYQGYVELRSNE